MHKRVLTRRGIPIVALGLAAALTFSGGGKTTFAEDSTVGESIPFSIPSSISGALASESTESALVQSRVAIGTISSVISGPTSESTSSSLESAPVRIGPSITGTDRQRSQAQLRASKSR